MKDITVDSRLVALYNEYLEKDMEYEFIVMLYILLDTVNAVIRKKVYQARAAWKRKTNAPYRKELRNRVEEFFARMTPEEWIEFQNTPWEEKPDWIKEALPKLVKNPRQCDSVRIYGLVNEKDRQQEIAASRLTRYMESHGFITTYEGVTTPHYDRFSEVCNELAAHYDLLRNKTARAQKTRITVRDLKNYTQSCVTPKDGKMAILTKVTNLPLWYLSGYGDNPEPEVKNPNPLAPAPFAFKKKRSKTAGDAA